MTVILKVIAEVEMLIPSFGFCSVPPCEEFAENVCDEFFSLPIFPQNPCADPANRPACACSTCNTCGTCNSCNTCSTCRTCSSTT